MSGQTGQQACRPIGVFDSGLGGLTVVKQIMRLMGGEDVIYLGDSARVPYGIKSPGTIRRFALQDQAFLLQFDPKVIVVACNTASAVALDALCAEAGDSAEVVAVVSPAAEAAVRLAGARPIGVVGTEAQTMTVVPGRTPCLRCILKFPPPPGVDPHCRSFGVLGPGVTAVGSFPAVGARKSLAGRVEQISPYLTKFDMWTNTLQRIDITNAPEAEDCPCCKDNEFEFLEP